MCAYQGISNVSFSENFAYTLIEWSILNYCILVQVPKKTFIKWCSFLRCNNQYFSKKTYIWNFVVIYVERAGSLKITHKWGSWSKKLFWITFPLFLIQSILEKPMQHLQINLEPCWMLILTPIWQCDWPLKSYNNCNKDL